MLNAIMRTKDIHQFTVKKARLRPWQALRFTAGVYCRRLILQPRTRKPFGCGIKVSSRRFMHAVVATTALTVLTLFGCSIRILSDMPLLAAASVEEDWKTPGGIISHSAVSYEAEKLTEPSNALLNVFSSTDEGLTNTDRMRLHIDEGCYNKALKVFSTLKQAAPPGSEQLYLAAVAYFQVRDYKNSFNCMMTAVETCTDPDSINAYTDAFSQIFIQDYEMLADANVAASLLEKNERLYQKLEQAIAIKKRDLQ